MTESATGRRARKKAATRQAIADAALSLFLERGYDAVSIRDITEAADVSTTTLFKHFTGKESLVFDRDTDREAELLAVVHDRPSGQGILEALRHHARNTYADISGHLQALQFSELVNSTPVLRDYSERMWTRHTGAFGDAIAHEIGASAGDVSCQALARYVLSIPALLRDQEDAENAIDTIFDLLDAGWTAMHGGA